jgi:hypothetical protein
MCRSRGDGLPFLFHLKMVIQTTQSRIDLAQGPMYAIAPSAGGHGAFCLTAKHCALLGDAQITTDLAERRQIEKLLLKEEARIKKYDDDHKNRYNASRRCLRRERSVTFVILNLRVR